MTPPHKTGQASLAPNDQRDRVYVTFTIGDQLFGIPILDAQDVFPADRITPIPRAQPEIAGLLNLRGRIVTVLSLRNRLGLPPGPAPDPMAIGFERAGESYALLVEQAGEVMQLSQAGLESPPAHLDAEWAALVTGVHRLDGRLLVILDINAILAFEVRAAA